MSWQNTRLDGQLVYRSGNNGSAEAIFDDVDVDTETYLLVLHGPT